VAAGDRVDVELAGLTADDWMPRRDLDGDLVGVGDAATEDARDVEIGERAGFAGAVREIGAEADVDDEDGAPASGSPVGFARGGRVSTADMGRRKL
jgi:hypothetical protein